MPKRLLLVDDDQFLLQAFGGKFATAGYETSYAGDGQKALDLLEQGLKPDIIVCDFRMPNMDGLAFGARVKANPVLKDIPFVYLTSEDFSPEVVENLKQMGIEDYIHKSMDPNDIVARVKTVVAPE